MTKKPLEKTVILAMFAAVSVVLVYFVHFPIFPEAAYLEYDPADVMIFLASMLISPVSSVVLTVVVAFIQGMLVSGFNLGIIMHIVATGTAAFVCGSIYRKRKAPLTAIIALAAAAIIATAVMIPMNYLLTPIYMDVPRNVVAALLVFPIGTFNLVKFGINALITGILLKPVSLALSKSGAISTDTRGN